MFNRSLHLILHCSTPPHFIKQAWKSALEHLAASSWCHTSSATICWCSFGVALCHLVDVVPNTSTPLPCWTLPTMSHCLGADITTSTTVAILHFPSVTTVGAASLMMGSQDSLSSITSLALAHLYTSKRLDIVRERAPFSHSPTLLRHLGILSHFLTCALTKLMAWDSVDSEWLYKVGQHTKFKAPQLQLLK